VGSRQISGVGLKSMTSAGSWAEAADCYSGQTKREDLASRFENNVNRRSGLKLQDGQLYKLERESAAEHSSGCGFAQKGAA
jgi:hypothetical protein